MRKQADNVRVTATRALALLALLALGCKAEGEDPQVGSNSNWLTACDVPADCSSDNIPECACGVCTVQCAADADCAGILDARCALESSAAARSSCIAEDMSLGICLPRCQPGSCDAEQACVDGACVLAALPASALCDELPAPSDADRRHADQLLALLEARRSAGDLVCGDIEAQPQAELRFSPELLCAARALAIDMEASRRPGIADSERRDTIERLQLTGYTATQWGETFALEAMSAEHALELMVSDPIACSQLVSASLIDVATAVSGDAYVITLAAP